MTYDNTGLGWACNACGQFVAIGTYHVCPNPKKLWVDLSACPASAVTQTTTPVESEELVTLREIRDLLKSILSRLGT